MEREIKFRGWHIERKMMSAPFSFDAFDVDWFIPFGCFEDEIKIMQYTDLKDKNGKEIYEGDILRNGWDEKEVGAVTFSNGSFNLGFGYLENIWTQAEDSEVIGNIYENPELLN